MREIFYPPLPELMPADLRIDGAGLRVFGDKFDALAQAVNECIGNVRSCAFFVAQHKIGSMLLKQAAFLDLIHAAILLSDHVNLGYPDRSTRNNHSRREIA